MNLCRLSQWNIWFKCQMTSNLHKTFADMKPAMKQNETVVNFPPFFENKPHAMDINATQVPMNVHMTLHVVQGEVLIESHRVYIEL